LFDEGFEIIAVSFNNCDADILEDVQELSWCEHLWALGDVELGSQELAVEIFDHHFEIIGELYFISFGSVNWWFQVFARKIMTFLKVLPLIRTKDELKELWIAESSSIILVKWVWDLANLLLAEIHANCMETLFELSVGKETFSGAILTNNDIAKSLCLLPLSNPAFNFYVESQEFLWYLKFEWVLSACQACLGALHFFVHEHVEPMNWSTETVAIKIVIIIIKCLVPHLLSLFPSVSIHVSVFEAQIFKVNWLLGSDA
jgi:hypothetical protein